MSGTFWFVLGILSIVTVGRLASESMKTKRKLAEGASEEQQARMNELEERVKTLERIVTDKRTKLADEIDSLN
ncbi:hypothetical protein [Reinekea marinisedimentorum]|uniref:Phage shock protein B n=1 Tax=Reinekea marinisedimentorum TaxID=230495 RepID=A0A4R3IB34_9GAMM|nr:hypothetical protein [Reinekea marinisedimentorum]TCS43800.1 hypothetical protein BCF53_101143 [Reinekea marinisedimentorum]